MSSRGVSVGKYHQTVTCVPVRFRLHLGNGPCPRDDKHVRTRKLGLPLIRREQSNTDVLIAIDDVQDSRQAVGCSVCIKGS